MNASPEASTLLYAVLATVVHVVVGTAAAMAIGPHSLQPMATSYALWNLGMASAAMSAVGLVATASYLSRRIRPRSGLLVGLLCGLLCGTMLGLAMLGVDYSLILYLAILAPTLLAVLLATLMDRSKSGWQT